MTRPHGGATHTVAGLEVSKACWDEIAEKLRAAGYDHAFGLNGDSDMIDMTGIGLVVEPDVTPICDRQRSALSKPYGGDLINELLAAQPLVTPDLRRRLGDEAVRVGERVTASEMDAMLAGDTSLVDGAIDRVAGAVARESVAETWLEVQKLDLALDVTGGADLWMKKRKP